MKNLSAREIRSEYLSFFEERGHKVYPSDSLIPASDPTLLFTGAGMNQFKDMFMGVGSLPFSRAATSQKCLRTGDLEVVGVTPRHHTFFEMLGNFSFGDYFKREAIEWAWEFLVNVLEIRESRLTVSVHTSDDEAHGIWRETIGLPESRIARLGDHDNFWPADAPAEGPNGPCGPCSEIFYDLGENMPEGDRHLEVWNLVFTQFERSGPAPGEGVLKPLAQKNIDTGMGLERLRAVLAGVQSNFDTELFLPIIKRVAEMAGKKYVFDSPDGVRMRRISDHVRAAVFCIADGASPGNTGRRYVVRKIVRRAVRDGVSLGIREPFLHELAPVVVQTLGEAYPEIAAKLGAVRAAVETEESQFLHTLDKGLSRIEALAADLRERGEKKLGGADAFALFAEQGMPLEVIKEELAVVGLDVNEEEFQAALEEHRRVSGNPLAGTVFDIGPLERLKYDHRDQPTVFLGYDAVETDATLLGIISGKRLLERASESDGEVALLLDRTVFYGESGGQVGDRGEIALGDARFRVEDTIKSGSTHWATARGVYHLHRGRVLAGKFNVGDTVHARIDAAFRDAVRRNHTATHLLHGVLREHAESATQAGSLVAPDRLRFDVSCARRDLPEPARIERAVNELIRRDLPVTPETTTLERARELGAMALFGEKYAGEVRMVDIGDGVSRELCGGCHVARTGEIGYFRVTDMATIAAGVMRIEAVTGGQSVDAALGDHALVHQLGAALKTPPTELPDRVQSLMEEVKSLRRELDDLKRKEARSGIDGLLDGATRAGDASVIAAVLPDVQGGALRDLADLLRRKAGSAVVVLGAGAGKKPSLVVAATKDVVARGFDSGAVVREIAGHIGGGGGGRKDFAQAGGKDAGGLEKAVREGEALALRALEE